MSRFKRWSIEESDLHDLNPIKARDLIMRCFYEGQKETITKAKQRLGFNSSERAIYKSVAETLRIAFKDVGGNFEEPTKETLTKVVEVLAKKASSWGTPKDVIRHNKEQVLKIISLLNDV